MAMLPPVPTRAGKVWRLAKRLENWLSAPAVAVDKLGEFTFVFSVQAWVKTADFSAAQSDLQFEVRRRFQTAPVAAPQRLVGVANENSEAA